MVNDFLRECFFQGAVTAWPHPVFDSSNASLLHSRFAQMGTDGIRHLIFDPVITLARSGEMTAGFSDRDAIYPVDTIRENHIDLIIPLPNIKDQASEP